MTAISDEQFISTIYDRLLIEDDTEEMERLLRDREARLVELEAQLAHLQKQSED